MIASKAYSLHAIFCAISTPLLANPSTLANQDFAGYPEAVDAVMNGLLATIYDLPYRISIQTTQVSSFSHQDLTVAYYTTNGNNGPLGGYLVVLPVDPFALTDGYNLPAYGVLVVPNGLPSVQSQDIKLDNNSVYYNSGYVNVAAAYQYGLGLSDGSTSPGSIDLGNTFNSILPPIWFTSSVDPSAGYNSSNLTSTSIGGLAFGNIGADGAISPLEASVLQQSFISNPLSQFSAIQELNVTNNGDPFAPCIFGTARVDSCIFTATLRDSVSYDPGYNSSNNAAMIIKAEPNFLSFKTIKQSPFAPH